MTVPTAALRGALLLLLSACGEAAPSPPATVTSTARTDTLPGGIVRTRNPDAPAPLDWHFVEERVIQPADGSAGALGDVRGAVATADGHVAVVQTKPDAVLVFNPDGTFARSIGKSGEGPGEFRQAALGIHGDTLLVHDPSASRATTFLLDGTLLGSWRAPCCLIGLGTFQVDGAGRAWIVAMQPGGGVFVRYRFDGTLIDTVAATPHQAGGTWMIRSGRGMGGMAVSIPLYPSMEWGYTPDGHFIYGRGDTYRIMIGRNGTDTLRIIEAGGEGRPTTEAERDSLLRDVLPSAVSVREALQQVASQGDIPRRWPIWHTLAMDGDGRLWVGRPGPGADVATLDVFAATGERIGTMPAPHPRILDGFWHGDRVVLHDQDDNGRALVRVYRLVRDTVPS